MNNLGILVLGMHRSGTSALAGSLAALGVHMGEALVPPIEGKNDKGHWENLPIVKTHDRILGILRRSWDDVRPLPDGWLQMPEVARFREEIAEVIKNDCLAHPIWGIKDPRMCRVMPLWLEVLESLEAPHVFALIHRDPLEVALSLKRRDGFDEVKSGLLWVDHNLQAEKWTRGLPRVHLSYAELLGDPKNTARKIINLTGEEFINSSDQKLGKVKSFVSPRLHHHKQAIAETDFKFGNYQSLVVNTYQALNEASESENPDLYDRFDKLQREYEVITSAFSAALSAHIDGLISQVDILRLELDHTRASLSWKMTRPLRMASKLVNRIASRRPV